MDTPLRYPLKNRALVRCLALVCLTGLISACDWLPDWAESFETEGNQASFEIDGRQIIINGTPLTVGGSADELIDLLGPPSYPWTWENPTLYIWQELGLEVLVINGCLRRYHVRLMPRPKSEVELWHKEHRPGFRALPAFPGRVIMDGAPIHKDSKLWQVNEQKRGPKIPRGLELMPYFEIESGIPYSFAIDLDYYTKQMTEITHEVSINHTCEARPIVTLEQKEGEA